MKEVVASSHDRRQWGVLAAAWVGVSEREFVNAAARELGMPYQDNVSVPDLTVFGAEARELLRALRKIGAVVQLQEGDRIVGFVATDPAEVRGLDLFDGTQVISMAPWTEIAKALDMAERLIGEAEANTDRNEALRRKELCEKVINLLIQEAVKHGASGLEILSSEGKGRYQFTTIEGRVAVGAIHPEALEGLLLHLNGVEGELLAHPLVGKVLVRSLGSAANLRLSWSVSDTPIGIAWDGNDRVASPAPLSARESIKASPESRESPGTKEISEIRGIPQASDKETVKEAANQVPINDKVRVESLSEQTSEVPVLVIDDNPMFCRILERLLGRDRFQVSFATNGKVALELLLSQLSYLPRVIICDLHMPEMNGKEFIRCLREDARLSSIPVIVLTSDDGIEVEVAALETGADALVSKSKDPRVLCAQVARLSRSGSLQEAA